MKDFAVFLEYEKPWNIAFENLLTFSNNSIATLKRLWSHLSYPRVSLILAQCAQCNVFFSFQIGFVVLKLSTWFPSFSVDSWTLITVFCMSPRSLVKTQRLPNKLSCLFISIFLFNHQKIILWYKIKSAFVFFFKLFTWETFSKNASMVYYCFELF